MHRLNFSWKYSSISHVPKHPSAEFLIYRMSVIIFNSSEEQQIPVNY